jgi:uncharacterized protein (TIGR00369 family)
MPAQTTWIPKNPDFQKLITEAFAVEPPMVLIGATMEKVEPGFVEIHLPIRREVMTGYVSVVHGGVLGMLADAALAQAAYTLAEPGAQGATAQYTLHFTAPATGERVIARGSVVKPGRRMTVAQAHVYSVSVDGEERLVGPPRVCWRP